MNPMTRTMLLGLSLLFFAATAWAEPPAACGGFPAAVCRSNQYCDYPDAARCGEADQQGECRERPEICTQQHEPVCGCDGKTYGNACQAHQAGADVAREGTCEVALCPSGTYTAHTIPVGAGPAVVLTGRVTLPTSGWIVRLKQRPERILPPMYDFVCERPAGMVLQVLTDYTASAMVPNAAAGDQLSVTDASGETLVPVSEAAASAASTAACSTNDDCKGADEYCAKKRCGGKGVCRTKPGQCPLIYLPVMACDGKVHPNACVANSVGENVKSRVNKPSLRAD